MRIVDYAGEAGYSQAEDIACCRDYLAVIDVQAENGIVGNPSRWASFIRPPRGSIVKQCINNGRKVITGYYYYY